MRLDRDSILFLCVANSARSQMAEGLARAELGPAVPVFSAGSEPTTVNPHAVEVMAEVGIDIRGHHAKPIRDVPADRIALVVTLCAAEVCPVFPGDVRRLHWPLEDPAAAEGSEAEVLAAFRTVRDELADRLGRLPSLR